MAEIAWRTCALALALLPSLFGEAGRSFAQAPAQRIAEALQNMTSLQRPGRVGYATIWDGNRYVQCRRMPEQTLRCEAAGLVMQPSLKSLLSPERIGLLQARGWQLEPGFGNYVRTFPAEMAAGDMASEIHRALSEAYGADPSRLEITTRWMIDIPCPPRNGPSRNLAGSVNDAPEMRATAVRGCAYAPDPGIQALPTETLEGLQTLCGASLAAEIQRLSINKERHVFAVFTGGLAYVQCMPAPSENAIYCEAQSEESWPALAAILTAERRIRLREAGYSPPGRSPNYARLYPFDSFSDQRLAREVLTILHEVYGYTGTVKLKVTTER